MLPAPLAAQSGARGIHAHLPERFRILYDLSYVGEVMLSISEKSLHLFFAGKSLIVRNEMVPGVQLGLSDKEHKEI